MQVVNRALEVGRALQRKQTDFVHYCHQAEDLASHDTIPILENALFALALFRSRMSDAVLEGKEILEKLLAFEIEGNFPVYLHEFPKRVDPFLGIRLLPVLFWIYYDFSHVIGELKGEIPACIDRIIAHAKTLSLPEWAKMRLLAFEGKIGDLPSNQYEWGDALISLQIAQKKGASIEEAIQIACDCWHPELFIYCGPDKRWNQERRAIQQSLFALFMHAWQKTSEILPSHPLHLKGALIRPLTFKPIFGEKPVPYIDFQEEGECPLFIAWKGEGIIHTFVLAKRHLEVSRRGEELLIQYPEEELDSGLEANLFLNHHPDHEIFIEGEKASTFQIGEEVEIRSKGIRIALKFFAEEGRFFGHLMRGNRLSQHTCKGDDQFTAFDWRIVLRTVVREPNTSIRIQVLAQKMPENRQLLPLHASHYPHTELSL